MSSTTTSSANYVCPFSQTAEIRVLISPQWFQSQFKSAHVLVSSRIYWQVGNKDGTNKPQSLSDFRNANSLELVRLNADETWNKLDEIVKVSNYEGRTRIKIRGRLHGPTRRKNLSLVRDAEIEIIPNTRQQLEVWVNKIRARITPWNLLEQELKHASEVEEFEIALGGLATSMVGNIPSSMPTEEVEENWGDKLGTLPEKMQKLSIVDELIVHGTAAVETGATLTKLVAIVERVAETAEFVADATKCVAGVSTIFHLVALSAQGISMCAEAKRGQRVLPVALCRIVILLRYVLESMTQIMKPTRSVNELDREFVFKALRQILHAMDIAETQLLRARCSQVVNAGDVTEVKRKIEELEPLVVAVNNTSRICALGEEVTQLKKGQETWGDGPHHVRPSVSPFFSGRKKELKTLEGILEEWGSAVITQYGGLGKTELMIAFADRAEREKRVPGGVFWVTVDGSERDAIGSLAELAGRFIGKKMSEEERRNVNLVIKGLKEGLGQRQGRWLLCLDNADDAKVSGILNEVCGITGPSRDNGWIIVTSRKGLPHVWNRMKSEQKLALEPLCAEDAMVALWRQVEKIETADLDDDKVMVEVKKLKDDKQAEYYALKKLCGDVGGHGLGGLPLALVQAGSYIAQHGDSFAEYLDLFEGANKNESWENVMNKTDDVKPIHDRQRSIWTTWKINVEKLSRQAYTVLRAMSMLGQGGIGKAIVTRILITTAADGGGSVEEMFRNVVVKELIHGSSLISCDQGEGEEIRMYKMHRLVRLFILSEIVRGSMMWNYVYGLALPAIHKTVRAELENEGNSFYELPGVFGNNHRRLAVHSLALVHHHMLPEVGGQISHDSEVDQIHWYTGKLMEFLGKSEEEVRVWEHFLDILSHQQEENRRRSHIKRLRDMWYRRNRRKEVDVRIAIVYNSLGVAFMRTGKFEVAASKLEQSLSMKRAIHGDCKPHIHIASSLNNLGVVYREMGKLEEALEKSKESLEVSREIYGHSTPHPAIASSLNNLGTVHHQMNQLGLALEKHQESLKMKQEIHGNSNLHPDIASSFNNLGLVHRQMNNLDKALENHEQSLQICREIHGHNKPHPDIASALNNIALVHQETGELDKALERQEESLEMYQAIHGHSKPNPDTAVSLNNLGSLYHEMGNLDKALEKHQQSLEMYQAIPEQSKPHPGIASPLDNLGTVYRKMGDLSKALAKHEQSLEVYEEIHGRRKPHRDIASTLNNLGLVYEEMGELDEALEMYEQSLKMYREVHVQIKAHPDIALSLNNLGFVHRKMGDLAKALARHEESLEMKREIHGHGVPHSDTAISLCNIGNVYKDMGKLDKALEKHEQTLEMSEAIHGFGKDHADVASSLNNLGVVYQKMGKLDKALEKHKQSLDMYQAIHGSSKPHRDIVSSLNNLGTVLQRKGELEEAQQKHEQSLEMQRAIYGRDVPHPDVASSLHNLGLLYQRMGRHQEALESHEQSLKMYQAIYGTSKPHLDIALSLGSLGLLYKTMDRMDEAVEKLEESLKMRRTIYGHDTPHLDIASSLDSLGLVHQKLNELRKAAENYEQSLEMKRAIHGENKAHPDIALSLHNLGLLYKTMGKMDEAVEKLEEGLKMRRTIHGHGKPHLEITLSLDSLGLVYQTQGELQKALAKYKESLEMKLAIHGEGKPHSDTAMSLCNIGLVHQMQKNLNQAAKYQEQSIKMLQIVHGPDSAHPFITGLQSCLADVYKDQGRLDEGLAMRANNIDTVEASDGGVSNRTVGK